MNRFLIISLFLLVFFCISCENKVSVPNQEIPDGDSDTIPDEDTDNAHGPLLDLKVEKNEKNSLSCRLTFSTTDEKKTFVKYYSPTHSGYKIGEKTATNNHYFFLWGMRENLDYTIEIYSDEEEPELLATTLFHSGTFPFYVYPPHIVANEQEKVQPGFVILAQQSYPDNEKSEPIIFMVDQSGFVVWYFEHRIPGFALLGDPYYRRNTQTIFLGIQKGVNTGDIKAEEGLEIDLEGNIVWKSPDLPGSSYDEITWHHMYRILEDDTILFIRAQYQGNLISDRIVNLDKNYSELWNWGYFDSLDYFSDANCSESEDFWCDWSHTNSAMMFKDESTIYFNSLWLGFFKMDMNTKKILWKFGKDGDFTMLSDHQFPWPDCTHDPKFSDSSKKRLLFFDNGMKERFYSRIIEYEIDEEAMTAEITFEYDGLDSGHGWFAGMGWGDVDYLENGNFLITKGWGDVEQNSSVFEVTRDGKVVWELYTEHDDDVLIELYNADKFVPPMEFLNE
ncbi:aryl-sulfate sulfotransferase [bacterium]|nr:aryl-sulfate sulfotransferase [bacterium]